MAPKSLADRCSFLSVMVVPGLLALGGVAMGCEAQPDTDQGIETDLGAQDIGLQDISVEDLGGEPDLGTTDEPEVVDAVEDLGEEPIA